MFVMVRHAEAGSKHRWHGQDWLRPLSDHGQRQAAGLVYSLRDLDVRVVLTSPMTRCRQTVAPLAQARELTIHEHALLLPDADLSALMGMLSEPSIGGAVLCTHGETLTQILPQWQDLPRSGSPPDDQTGKGAAWIVEDYPGPRASLRYLAASPA